MCQIELGPWICYYDELDDGRRYKAYLMGGFHKNPAMVDARFGKTARESLDALYNSVFDFTNHRQNGPLVGIPQVDLRRVFEAYMNNRREKKRGNGNGNENEKEKINLPIGANEENIEMRKGMDARPIPKTVESRATGINNLSSTDMIMRAVVPSSNPSTATKTEQKDLNPAAK
ncbi:hypothetical protein P154DRAFT_579978 [Amniculicola lignicola CBS 123094]|uniref:Uncharacterized protein n=1 Tax=Amniculicola lignicola CBS 123094 TaxID=1392246 RepID=A0A6A5W3E6_9PLEO|nr:hypothetical protein P154DRAFT_579978 [Amniculicola lignicola CBS 123094]